MEIFKAVSGMEIETTPGGSAANTLAGVAGFGGKSLFIGKVGNDENGKIYIAETEKAGVKARIGIHDSISGHAIAFITSDSERTFATHLGASLFLDEKDINEEDIKNSRILHLEGYLFEPDNLYAASVKAMKIAKENGVLVSVDLSDAGLVGRIFDRLKSVVKDYADIVFANETEALSFTGLNEGEALDAISQLCSLSVVKLGAEGSLIKTKDEMHRIKSFKTSVVNTNGAGDMYAAGLLYGIANGYSLNDAGRIGSYASSLVVAQPGARLSRKIDAKKI
jgi:sugar/nucleoside kinase (ribokinase family)